MGSAPLASAAVPVPAAVSDPVSARVGTDPASAPGGQCGGRAVAGTVGYTGAMTEVERGVDTWCPACQRAVEEDALTTCLICRSLFCPGCAVPGYGREFCSTRCRDYFFFGDGDLGIEEGE